MLYRFEVTDMQAKKGSISRAEKSDIISYISSIETEAASGKKAFRMLADRTNGHLSRESTDTEAKITLPDYGDCRITVALRTV